MIRAGDVRWPSKGASNRNESHTWVLNLAPVEVVTIAERVAGRPLPPEVTPTLPSPASDCRRPILLSQPPTSMAALHVPERIIIRRSALSKAGERA